MKPFHLVRKTRRLLWSMAAGMAAVACAQLPSGANQSWLVVTEFPQWAPGRPQVFKQVVVGSAGQVQIAKVQGSTVQSLVEYTADTSGLFPVDRFFKLSDRYETPVRQGQIVDGRGNKTSFYFRNAERSKFITAEEALLPAELQKLRSQLPENNGKGRVGSFLQVKALDAATQSYLRATNPPTLSPAVLRDFEPLQRALATPYLLVEVSPAQARALGDRLSFKAPPFTVISPAGELVRVEVFE